MSTITQCPITSESRSLRSNINKCSKLDNYHCLKTEDNELRELCTSPIWIEAGKCPIYSRTGRLDAKICQAVQSRTCPTKVYKSNENFKYAGCLPVLRKESTTNSININTTPGPSHNITNPDNSDGGSILVAVSVVVPLFVVVLIVLIIAWWKRKEIRKWIENVATNRASTEPDIETASSSDLAEKNKRFSGDDKNKANRLESQEDDGSIQDVSHSKKRKKLPRMNMRQFWKLGGKNKKQRNAASGGIETSGETETFLNSDDTQKEQLNIELKDKRRRVPNAASNETGKAASPERKKKARKARMGLPSFLKKGRKNRKEDASASVSMDTRGETQTFLDAADSQKDLSAKRGKDEENERKQIEYKSEKDKRDIEHAVSTTKIPEPNTSATKGSATHDTDTMAATLLSVEILVLSYQSNENQTELANGIAMKACELSGFASCRIFRSFEDLNNLDKERVTIIAMQNGDLNEKLFCDKNVNETFKELRNVLMSGRTYSWFKSKNNFHALICIPNTVGKSLIQLLKKYSLRHYIYDISSM